MPEALPYNLSGRARVPHGRMQAAFPACLEAPRSPIVHTAAMLPGTCLTPGPMAERHPGPSSPGTPAQGSKAHHRGAWACAVPGCNGNASPLFGAHRGKPAAATAHTSGQASTPAHSSVQAQSLLAICAAHPEIPAWSFRLSKEQVSGFTSSLAQAERPSSVF